LNEKDSLYEIIYMDEIIGKNVKLSIPLDELDRQ